MMALGGALKKLGGLGGDKDFIKIVVALSDVVSTPLSKLTLEQVRPLLDRAGVPGSTMAGYLERMKTVAGDPSRNVLSLLNRDDIAKIVSGRQDAKPGDAIRRCPNCCSIILPAVPGKV